MVVLVSIRALTLRHFVLPLSVLRGLRSGAGVPKARPYVVAARLGHADPAITPSVYAHVIRSAEAAAAADIFAQAVKAA